MKKVNHLAIIMDGNRRWAKAKGIPTLEGHRRGVDAVRKVVRHCGEIGVETLTLFTFSTENTSRPKDELAWLFKLFLAVLKLETNKLNKANVQLEVIGDVSLFNAQLQTAIHDSVRVLSGNTGLKLVIAANFGGKWDIAQATQKIAELHANGDIKKDEIDDKLIENCLSLGNNPVDLLIRTSGEQRISNFLLWQLAYSELYFTDTFWPDFDEGEVDKAIAWYSGRERRFGGSVNVIDQVMTS